MTPTLLGRWQTRIFMLLIIGSIVTIPFDLGAIGPGGAPFFWSLFYICLFGLFWDILYNFLQQFFWDRDWPGIVQLITAIIEAIFLALVCSLFGLPGINKLDFNLFWFVIHYSTVWVTVYLLSWVTMRLFFPRWRFRGGQWL